MRLPIKSITLPDFYTYNIHFVHFIPYLFLKRAF